MMILSCWAKFWSLFAKLVERQDTTRAAMDLSRLPYPVQCSLYQYLSSADDIMNLRQLYPGSILESTANNTRGSWIMEKIFPHLRPHLATNETLKCRLVCRRWKQTVDTHMENVGLIEPDYSQSLHRIDVNSRFLDGNWTTYPFRIWHILYRDALVNGVSPELVLLRFIHEMDFHPGNPMPYRSVRIVLLNDLRDVETAIRFLQRFGRHIWKLQVAARLPEQQATLILRDLLHLTPNIRLLDIEFDDFGLPELRRRVKRHIYRNLKETGLLVLPHLTRLEWYMGPTFYRHGMPLYSENLVELRIPEMREEAEFLRVYKSSRHGTFPNLKLLEIWVGNEAQLWKLTQMRGPLENLTTICGTRIPLSVYLSVFLSFAQTLKAVTLDFDPRIHQDDFENLIYYNYDFEDDLWHFPMLTTLTLNNPNPLESLDILLAIEPGPKTLYILTDENRDIELDINYHLLFEEIGEEIEIHGFLHRMYDSIIWEKLPQLETIKVDVVDTDGRLIQKYTRKRWSEWNEMYNQL